MDLLGGGGGSVVNYYFTDFYEERLYEIYFFYDCDHIVFRGEMKVLQIY